VCSENNGIRAHVRDECNLEGIPSVWIENDDDYERAGRFVDEFVNSYQTSSDYKTVIIVAWICLARAIAFMLFIYLK